MSLFPLCTGKEHRFTQIAGEPQVVASILFDQILNSSLERVVRPSLKLFESVPLYLNYGEYTSCWNSYRVIHKSRLDLVFRNIPLL